MKAEHDRHCEKSARTLASPSDADHRRQEYAQKCPPELCRNCVSGLEVGEEYSRLRRHTGEHVADEIR